MPDDYLTCESAPPLKSNEGVQHLGSSSSFCSILDDKHGTEEEESEPTRTAHAIVPSTLKESYRNSNTRSSASFSIALRNRNREQKDTKRDERLQEFFSFLI